MRCEGRNYRVCERSGPSDECRRRVSSGLSDMAEGGGCGIAEVEAPRAALSRILPADVSVVWASRTHR